MSLSSYSFVFLLLPLATVGFWLLVHFNKQVAALRWLILGSVVFYACASLRSLIVVVPSILLDFAIARLFLSLAPSRTRERATLLGIGVAANILVLAYFKYHNFFLDAIGTLLGQQHISSAVALPLGISFLTFQKIAFLCDLFAGNILEVTFTEYLLFTLFFPRTVAGPIVHYREFAPQLKEIRREHMMPDIAVGFCFFSIGLFKKCVVADGIAGFVAYAFDPGPGSGPVTLVGAWTGALAYTLQLYFDFSGYSDMALGAARMVGIRLPMNFNSPLKATSMVDFWARWHITLTRFLTWYIYIPLVRRLTRARAISKKPLLRGPSSTPAAVISLIGVPTGITMLISGVWHGVGWPFVVWGLLHGAYLTINQAWRLWRPRFWRDQRSYDLVMRPIGFVLTFGAVVVGLVFFHADSIGNAMSIIAGMAGLHGLAPQEVQVLWQAGYLFDWTVVWAPWDSLRWIVLLLAVVTLGPNSLELLRRFQPSLDFPGPRQPTPAPHETKPEPARAHTAMSGIGKLRGVQQGWVVAKSLGQAGLTLNWLTATMVGVLFTLGAMAMSHSAQFLYGAF
jgi:alginate O-acetyltransferase complex protein AlgI